jgi:hypothetical protein
MSDVVHGVSAIEQYFYVKLFKILINNVLNYLFCFGISLANGITDYNELTWIRL